MKEQPQTRRMNWHYLIWWSVKEEHRKYWKALMKIQPPYDLTKDLGPLSFYKLKPPTLESWSDTNPHKKEELRRAKTRHKEIMDQLEFNKKSYPYLDPITGKPSTSEENWDAWRHWLNDELFYADGSRVFPKLNTHWMLPPEGDTIRWCIGKLKEGWIPKEEEVSEMESRGGWSGAWLDGGEVLSFLFPLKKGDDRFKRPLDHRMEIKKEIEEEKEKLGPELYKKYFPHKDQPLDVDEIRKIKKDMPKTRENRKFYEKMEKLFRKEASTKTNKEKEVKTMSNDNYYEDSTERETLQKQIESIAEEEKELKEDQKEKKKRISALQKQLGGISKDQSPAQRKAIDNDKKTIDKLVGQISKSWNISRQEIIKTAVVLHEAKEGVKKIHGASWTFLTERKLPFGKKTADRLAKIGGCSFVVDNIDSLPAAYTTLWEISEMPEWMFDEAFASGEINESCWRKDIIEIKNKHEGKEPKEKKEPTRTLPIGIINVPKDSFEMSVDDKTFWDPDKIEAFQLKTINALKTLTGAAVDFSKINEVVERQEERRLEKESGDPVKDTLKVIPKLVKGLKEKIKKSPSHYVKYYGSRKKQEDLRADFFSNITITALTNKLMSEFDEDNWNEYAEGTITAEYLEAESKKEEVQS